MIISVRLVRRLSYRLPLVDIPAECVRLIFSLNVISAGRDTEGAVNQTGTDPVNSPSHTHTYVHTYAMSQGQTKSKPLY